ncbi:hypothetical protein HG619_26520, partial [Pseudomonas syringae]|nr:hypothetical protein [Pseudomonas syringae]
MRLNSPTLWLRLFSVAPCTRRIGWRCVFLTDEKDQGLVLTYRDLDLRARTIAAALQRQAVPGIGQFCCSIAGPTMLRRSSAACMPGSLPCRLIRRNQSSPSRERLLSIIADAEPRLLLTGSDLQPALLQMDELAAAVPPL